MSGSGVFNSSTIIKVPVFEDVERQSPQSELTDLRSAGELFNSKRVVLEEPPQSQSSSGVLPVYTPKIGDLVDWWAEDAIDIDLLRNLYGEGPLTVEKLLYDKMTGYLVYLSKEVVGGMVVFSRKQFVKSCMGSGWHVATKDDLHEGAGKAPSPEDCFLVRFIRKIP